LRFSRVVVFLRFSRVVVLLRVSRVFAGIYYFAIADLAPPLTGRFALHHHESAEVLQIESGASARGAPQAAGLLEETTGVVLDNQQDSGQIVAERVERNDAFR
jgi:hypothetical protein